MPHTRAPAVAGLFYPDEPHVLRRAVEDYLHAAKTTEAADLGRIKAVIAPHAGYIYSAPVAASVYARLQPLASIVRRVVLLGPSHRVPFAGLALPDVEEFATPLGTVRLDAQAMAEIAHLPQVQVLNTAHAGEHSLEVHLPFLQVVLGDFSLVPLVVGDADPPSVAEVLEHLWGGDETLFVVSSDLSHYHDYTTAQRLDAATSRAIERLRPQDIGYEDACGRDPVNGLLHLARERGLHAHTLDLRNSGDTAGGRGQVVGYGAYLFA